MLLRQDLAVIVFMWHYILYLEFHINCNGLIEGIEQPQISGQNVTFTCDCGMLDI